MQGKLPYWLESCRMPIEKISRIHHVAMTVRDGPKSAEWYRNVFGFQLIQKFTRTWLIGTEACSLGLFQLADGEPVQNLDTKIAIQHIAFHVAANDFNNAVEVLRDLGIPFEGPDDAGVAGPSVFFNDPDGHELEITAYQAPSK
jgi:catechol 2,3-dioxygenase-like lactoylglutathione lyase family enzyme